MRHRHARFKPAEADLIPGTGSDMTFREKVCAFDREFVSNSLIYPL
jgi:hypothetical protein